MARSDESKIQEVVALLTTLVEREGLDLSQAADETTATGKAVMLARTLAYRWKA